MTNLQQLHQEWKDIPNFEGLYQVSSLGNIRSLDKLIYRDGYKPFLLKGRVMQFIYSVDGYKQVMLYKKGIKRKSYKVNDIVFFTFNPGVKKTKGFEIDHDDNDKTNNASCNLKYITNRANSTKRSLNFKKTSKYTGVSWDTEKGKWAAYIRINSKSTYLGRYTVEEEAAQAYQTALKQLENKAV